MENLKEALEYIARLAGDAEKTEVLEICGKTYANRRLERYDTASKARPLTASSLTALVDYIGGCSSEMERDMVIHVVSPRQVRLMSTLDADREREVLFETNAVVSEFQFDRWYDQERFMIELQANFEPNEDRAIVAKLAGNVQRKNDQTFTDDGMTQLATMQVGVATKADVIVPNPVELVPYRTFQEVAQPVSKFVFRMGDKEDPAFKLIEADGGTWKLDAVSSIKEYLMGQVQRITEVRSLPVNITIIG